MKQDMIAGLLYPLALLIIAAYIAFELFRFAG